MIRTPGWFWRISDSKYYTRRTSNSLKLKQYVLLIGSFHLSNPRVGIRNRWAGINMQVESRRKYRFHRSNSLLGIDKNIAMILLKLVKFNYFMKFINFMKKFLLVRQKIRNNSKISPQTFIDSRNNETAMLLRCSVISIQFGSRFLSPLDLT